jgi:hypothetical protein
MLALGALVRSSGGCRQSVQGRAFSVWRVVRKHHMLCYKMRRRVAFSLLAEPARNTRLSDAVRTARRLRIMMRAARFDPPPVSLRHTGGRREEGRHLWQRHGHLRAHWKC